MIPSRPRAAVLAALLAFGSARLARAQGPEPPRGTVLALDGGELVLDLAASRGVKVGQRVELWRPLRVKHPVTGQVLTDRFRIGTVHLVQVQDTLSLGRTEGELARAPAVGDLVVVPESAPTAPRTDRTAKVAPAPAPLPEPPAAAEKIERPEPAAKRPEPQIVVEDRDGRALGDLFTALEGADPAARAHAYARFLEQHPTSRFAASLREEIATLRALVKEKAPYANVAPALPRVRPGHAQEYAVELDPRFVGAVVHVRRKGDAAYRSIPMASLGPRYWGATLPGDAIAEPGMQVFTEGVTREGKAVSVIGSATEPRDVAVDPAPLTGKNPSTLARVDLQSELASFDVRSSKDWLLQTEGTFTWRLGDRGVRAVRSGFGVLRGKGGSLRDLDELGKAPTDVGLTYGYLELEVAPTSSFSVIGRPILGLREGGVAGGAQGFFRVGSDLATNLLVGGELLGGIGLRGIVQLSSNAIRRVPVAIRTEVTNQPAGAGGDVGARVIAQAGYELVRDLTVSGRVSYQGRTINHAGPGAGLAVSYQW